MKEGEEKGRAKRERERMIKEGYRKEEGGEGGGKRRYRKEGTGKGREGEGRKKKGKGEEG